MPVTESARSWLAIFGFVAALTVVTYAPVAYRQPFIADDYVNLWKALEYAPPSGWRSLAADPIHFFRPVLILPSYLLLKIFGPWPPAFYSVSMLLHVVTCWLVVAMGRWRQIGFHVSIPAAVFFAVREGHQEAVLWYSAIYEPFQAAFILAGLLAWIAWLEGGGRARRLHLLSLLCFLGALASKESAVMMIPLATLPLFWEPEWRRQGFRGLIPFLAVAGAWFGWMLLGPRPYPRLGDGSFSLAAPFWKTWSNSFVRLLWPWGWLGVVVLATGWKEAPKRFLLLAAVWISVALVPYSFLTYMTRIPSRQTYMAGVGLSWIVAAAWILAKQKWAPRSKWVAAVAALVLLFNAGYIWTKKKEQFWQRAQATEALIRFVATHQGKIRVERFPYPLAVAQGAILLRAGRPPEDIEWAVSEVSRDWWDYRFAAIPEPASAGPLPATH